MLDFITGFLLGKRLKTYEPEPIEELLPEYTEIEEIIEPPKVYKYAFIPEITDFDATLEAAYRDYEQTNLVLICDKGHKYYYSEVLVPETQTTWGDGRLLDKI